MATARQILALLRSHIEGDGEEFFSTALQAAAHEAELGHGILARKLRDLVEKGRSQHSSLQVSGGAVPLITPRGDLANLLSASYPHIRLNAMTLPKEQRDRIERILLEQRHSQKLQAHNLAPRRKVLLVGPPGSGKTMTASVIAGELRLPLFSILLEGIITKFMGETAQKLRLVFETMTKTRGVYLFDEFDAIGTKRMSGNDVGEIRRVLNSFLQLLENDRSQGVIVAATNHPDLLDPALFRRFDDVLTYQLPSEAETQRLVKGQLVGFAVDTKDWSPLYESATGLSHADIVRAAQEAAKSAVLQDSKSIRLGDILVALAERRASLH
jgi:SpoVK/Ycf46/Vps4 family AAA+-type ATPase